MGNRVWATAQKYRITNRFLDFLCRMVEKQTGLVGTSVLMALIGVVVTILILGTVIPILWPLASATTTNITAMSGTDTGTTMIKTFWPIALLLIGVGIGVAVIVYALKEFGILS